MEGEMNKKILIVDDQSFIRTLLEFTLERLADQGVELLVAADGEKALELALRENPELILLDVAMPNLDGYEVCERVRASGSNAYVIMLTARGQAKDHQRGVDVGANEYITKPFNPDYILKQAVNILGLNV
jgi:two-component system alkaline phosphatase synthesis response regulator PhoP